MLRVRQTCATVLLLGSVASGLNALATSFTDLLPNGQGMRQYQPVLESVLLWIVVTVALSGISAFVAQGRRRFVALAPLVLCVVPIYYLLTRWPRVFG